MTDNKKLIQCSACKKEISKKAKACPHCGESMRKPFWKTLWWRIPVGIFILLMIASWFVDTDVVPDCDGYLAKTEVIDTFNNGPMTSSFNLRLLEMEEIEEVSFDEERGYRTCKARGLTNAAREVNLEYSFETRGDGTYWIEIEPISP